ncbi:DUF2892 domain-containing protein [Phototrophicus methaneseepsis]|uniref:DUF2892 domain-containing protein n=1 Tax=Phototrophicus methaneseepsis TaxID=2710758 RepID=A0A7S8EDL2_9CHLR|nr:DUF2892 domain-containing protein [Phototrophicus methaneseepsis]QPC85027.1 DUF2892 domain-containing protein [Phototrophicus methaneseepsis]
MTRNESNLDRIIRIVLAVVFFVVAATVADNQVVQIGGIVLGAILLITAAVGFCPLYRLFGFSTCPTNS